MKQLGLVAVGMGLALLGCGPRLADESGGSADESIVELPALGQDGGSARPFHVVVVLDITNVWSLADFTVARDSALSLFDGAVALAGEHDLVGCVGFHGKFGTELTALVGVDDALERNVREQWVSFRPASLREACPGGPRCAPWMPWQYSDETGADPSIGLEMARRMLVERGASDLYRAVVLLTHGQARNVGPHLERWNWGEDEARWRYTYAGPDARTVAEIEAETLATAAAGWRDDNIHTWVVAFGEEEPFLRRAVQGDGVFVRADGASDVLSVLRRIAEALAHER